MLTYADVCWLQEGRLSAAVSLLAALKERYREHNSEAAATNSHPHIGACNTCLAQVAFAEGRYARISRSVNIGQICLFTHY
jgi:uncharacterized membrane protein